MKFELVSTYLRKFYNVRKRFICHLLFVIFLLSYFICHRRGTYADRSRAHHCSETNSPSMSRQKSADNARDVHPIITNNGPDFAISARRGIT